MNTSSLQKLKMAARMLAEWNHISYKSSRKDGLSKNGGHWWEKCPAGVSERPSKGIKVRHGLKILKTYKLCWRTLWISLPTSTSLVFARLSSVFSNELVLVSLAPCHSLNQGCKQQDKTLFDTVSTGFDVYFLSCTCWLLIKKSLMRSEFWQLQSQWNWT